MWIGLKIVTASDCTTHTQTYEQALMNTYFHMGNVSVSEAEDSAVLQCD